MKSKGSLIFACSGYDVFRTRYLRIYTGIRGGSIPPARTGLQTATSITRLNGVKSEWSIRRLKTCYMKTGRARSLSVSKQRVVRICFV